MFRNRLTHSLQVARTAYNLAQRLSIAQREVAEELGGVDADATEAAALAHDLGHPPFGHVGEQELNELVTKTGNLDGFEGNAQSFRIVTKLEVISPSFVGLNLTRATLNAMLKYPRLRVPHTTKWGAYSTERDVFRWARELEPPGDERKSAEAELMDWADDITYAVHDVEDFYRAGLIPLHYLSQPGADSERKLFFDSVFNRVTNLEFKRRNLEQAFTNLILFFPLGQKYGDTSYQRHRLNLFTSFLYARYADGIRLRVPRGMTQSRVEIEPELEKELFMFKQLVWTYVIESPSLATQQYGQRKIIQGLFEILHEAVTSKKVRTILPLSVREALERTAEKGEVSVRIICDLIAGMTERQASFLYRRLTGQRLGSAFDYVGY